MKAPASGSNPIGFNYSHLQNKDLKIRKNKTSPVGWGSPAESSQFF
jgi:hypothetical protein